MKRQHNRIELVNRPGDFQGPLDLYLIIHNAEEPENFHQCAQIRLLKPKEASALFTHDGIKGEVKFRQVSPFHPVVSSVKLEGLEEGAGSFHVHSYPAPPKSHKGDTECSRTGGHYNPHRADPTSSPKPGQGSFDKYEAGDLSGKYGTLKGYDHILEKLIDPNLSLFGKFSIVGRSIVIHKTPVPKRWVCANILETGAEMSTAVASFTYPIAGKIIFRFGH